MESLLVGHPGTVALVLLLAVYLLARVLKRRKYPLPPGPPGDFLLGHYRKVPLDAAFKQYAAWGREYSVSPTTVPTGLPV